MQWRALFLLHWKQKLGQLGDGSQGTETDTFKTRAKPGET